MIIDQNLEDKVRNLCTRLNISTSFNFVATTNPSNNLPYHNWYHALCMVEKCIEGSNYHNLPYRSLRHLAVAALFHDYAHTGGHKEDSENIDLALCGLQAFGDLRSSTRTVDYGIDLDEVEQIIRVTQYPYIEDPCCIEQKIIRDADLMQSFRPDTWKEMILDGLRREMIIKLKKDITEKEMCKGQIEFLKNIHPRSDWGKEIMYKRGVIDEAVFNFGSLI